MWQKYFQCKFKQIKLVVICHFAIMNSLLGNFSLKACYLSQEVKVTQQENRPHAQT